MGIVALHVESGRRLELNAAEEFEAASVIKLALLTEAVALEHEGRFDLTDRWKLNAKSVAAGSGMLDEFDPGLTPTNRDLLQLMIAISDNTAADRFIDLFGAEAVNARMAALGLDGIRLVGRIPSKGQEPRKWPPLGVMTPRDTAEFYRRVATRTLLDPASDRLLAKLLATQHMRDRLPRLLLDESGTSWAGKTGSYGSVRNDSGILTTKKGRFVLVAFTDPLPDSAGSRARAIRAMGEIAAAVVNEWSSSLPDLERGGGASPSPGSQASGSASGENARRGPPGPRRPPPRPGLPRHGSPFLGSLARRRWRRGGRLSHPDAQLLVGRV